MAVTSRHHYQIVSKGQAKHSDYSTESRSCWHITCLAFCLCWNAAREKGESALTNLRPSTKAEEGWRKKKLREKEYDNTIRQISVICCREFGETLLWDWQFGVAVAPGKPCMSWKDTSSVRTHFTNSARPTECDLASVVRSQHRPGLSLPALGYVALCSTAVWLFPRQEI